MKQLKHFWCCRCHYRCCGKSSHTIFPSQYSPNPLNFLHTGRLHSNFHTSKKKHKTNDDENVTWNIPNFGVNKKVETYVRFIQFYEYCLLIDLAVAPLHFISFHWLHHTDRPTISTELNWTVWYVCVRVMRINKIELIGSSHVTNN